MLSEKVYRGLLSLDPKAIPQDSGSGIAFRVAIEAARDYGLAYDVAENGLKDTLLLSTHDREGYGKIPGLSGDPLSVWEAWKEEQA